MSLDVSGISRSGRIRKKSAKLKEMEEVEKTDSNGLTKPHNSSKNSIHQTPITNGQADRDETPKKSKKLKIKFSLDNGGVEEMPIDNAIEQSDLNYVKLEPTVPSLKIKLFQNSVGKYRTSLRFKYF